MTSDQGLGGSTLEQRPQEGGELDDRLTRVGGAQAGGHLERPTAAENLGEQPALADPSRAFEDGDGSPSATQLVEVHLDGAQLTVATPERGLSRRGRRGPDVSDGCDASRRLSLYR